MGSPSPSWDRDGATASGLARVDFSVSLSARQNRAQTTNESRDASQISGIAEVDLEEIWILIAADSVENAARFVTEFEAKIGTLEQMPSRCPAIPENALLGTEYRHLIIGDYRVIFRVEGPTVYVLRIIHGNRLLDISLFGE